MAKDKESQECKINIEFLEECEDDINKNVDSLASRDPKRIGSACVEVIRERLNEIMLHIEHYLDNKKNIKELFENKLRVKEEELSKLENKAFNCSKEELSDLGMDWADIKEDWGYLSGQISLLKELLEQLKQN